MTSPEWLAADEDDSDRFPQTSQESAQISTHSPDEGSRVVPDPARVARYAEAQCVMVGHRLATTAYDAARFRISELETPMGWRLGDVIARLVLDSGAVAVADEERASLVELVREMGREAVTEAEAYRAVLARAEAAEAKVAKVKALADEWKKYGRRPPEFMWASLRAVLADAPAVDRGSAIHGRACLECGTRIGLHGPLCSAEGGA